MKTKDYTYDDETPPVVDAAKQLEVVKPNARLIAAAPQLLEALRALTDDAGNCRIFPETLDRARAALALVQS